MRPIDAKRDRSGTTVGVDAAGDQTDIQRRMINAGYLGATRLSALAKRRSPGGFASLPPTRQFRIPASPMTLTPAHGHFKM